MVDRNKIVSPESCGISSATVEKYLRILNENGYAMHSVLMSRNGKLFCDAYWKPFDSEYHHRMNSVTKSFVGLAVGALIEEGKLSFDDLISKFFPECEIPENVADLTVYDLMTMRTPFLHTGGHWVKDGVTDRIPRYFKSNVNRPKQTSFLYDSPGSNMLGVIVERIAGRPFTEYLMDKFLRRIGFSENTRCIKNPDGYSWGDSGLLVRPHDLHSLALLMMNDGIFEGEQLIDRSFLKLATSRISDSNMEGYLAHNTFGYGMQIWKSYDDGFSFNGMGSQFMICVPKRRFIFVCTADNQGNQGANPVILSTLYHNIISELSDDPLPENMMAFESLKSYTSDMELVSQKGEVTSCYSSEYENVTYRLNDNPMKIEWIRLNFTEGGGILSYKNVQGEKELPFRFGRNLYTDFPQEGYPDMQINVPCPGNKFPCAVSAAWSEPRLLAIRVQMIGKHLGGFYITIAFSGDEVSLRMLKNTNCILHEYNGQTRGIRKKQNEGK